jgi:poly(A) polymerase
MDHDQAALAVVERLQQAGHTAYFAGGWVRDLLLGRSSDDIDIATSARPEQVRRLFKKTIGVGEAFGVILVLLDGHSFEVATFRSDEGTLDGRRPEQVHFSTAQKDALRRDFTVNGLFYDPVQKQVFDFVGGQADLQAGLIRTIGNATERFQEDRLRMVRAVRFAALLNFEIVEETRKAIQAHASELFPSVSMERIWQELKKMALNPHLDRALQLLRELGLLRVIFPAISDRHEPTMPPNMPPIALLALLFPGATPLEYEELTRYLKCSRDELRWLLEYATCRDLEQSGNNSDLVSWAYFYSLPESHRQLQLLAALSDPAILEKHQHRRTLLEPHIDRLRNRTPLITSHMLLAEGIPAGPLMGKLLRLAEQLSILHDLHDPADLLPRLRSNPLWPK